MREGEDTIAYINRLLEEGWCPLCGEHRVARDGLCEICDREASEAFEQSQEWERTHPREAEAQKRRIIDRLNAKLIAHGEQPIPYTRGGNI